MWNRCSLLHPYSSGILSPSFMTCWWCPVVKTPLPVHGTRCNKHGAAYGRPPDTSSKCYLQRNQHRLLDLIFGWMHFAGQLGQDRLDWRRVGSDHCSSSSVVGLWTRMLCPIYEVVRIGTGPLLLQPGFQNRTGANPSLDSGCPTRII